MRMTPWEKFKQSPDPLTKIQEIKKALPNGPGLPAMYREHKEHGTVLGVPTLTVGRNIFASRKKIVEAIEGGE